MFSGFERLQVFDESVKTIVHRALRVQDGRAVFLKSSRSSYPSPIERGRLQNEHDLLSSIDVRGVARPLALEHGRSGPVLVLEDLGGLQLRDLLRRIGRLSLQDFFQVATRLASLVGALHERGIICKNLNPVNILVHPETGDVQLTDFSEATRLAREKPFSSPLDTFSQRLAYMSPEQTGRLNRTVDWRSDLYTVGVILFEMLTGRPPFASEDCLALVHGHIAVAPPSAQTLRPDVPRPLSDLVATLLAKSAEDRYQSAAGLLRDLEASWQAWQGGDGGAVTLRWVHLSDHFELVEKIYGREAQLEILFDAYAKAEVGGARMVAVSGQAGVGKSALVRELVPRVLERGGNFIEGKFDQFQRDIPYAPLTEAFRELIRRLLAGNTASLERWKRRLLERTGPNLKLVAQRVPELELLVGELPEVPELGTAETNNRAMVLIQQFIQAFADEEHPLVIFLDDLQWADAATLKALGQLLTSSECQHLLLIGAYREGEISPAGPLAELLQHLSSQRQPPLAMHLGPISVEHVASLLSRSAGRHVDACLPMAQLVHERTGGNPFFVRELLLFWCAQGAISFGAEDAAFNLDVECARSVGVPDDVAKLMTTRIGALPAATQQVLETASCIGNRFDLRTLAALTQRSEADLVEQLSPAIAAGLVISLSAWSDLPSADQSGKAASAPSCRFSHDRVQQAAHVRMAERERAATHLTLGRLLLGEGTASESDLYQVTQHLNSGIALVQEPEERERLARLNLEAGRRAKNVAAHAAAANWFEVGRSLLREDCWQSQYDLVLALHQADMEAAAASADAERMEALGATILEHARDVLARIPVFEARIQYCIAQAQPERALAIARDALTLLGVSLPARPGYAQIGIKLLRTMWAMSGRTMADLDRLPAMNDPEKLAAMRVLMRAISAAYIADPNSFALVVLEMVQLSLKHGNCNQSAFGYMTYGVLLCAGLGQLDRATRLGDFSLRLAERLGASEVKAKLYVSYYVVLEPFRHHLARTLKPYQEAHRAGLEAGDIEYACHAAMYYSNYVFWVGEPLEAVHAAQSQYLKAIENYRSEFHADYTRIFHQLVTILRDPRGGAELVGSWFDERGAIARLSESSNKTALFTLWHCKAVLSYLLGSAGDAAKFAARARKFAQSVQGSINPALNLFYEALALLKAWPEQSLLRRWASRLRVAWNVRRLSRWARSAPMNYAHKRDLVLAEYARVRGKSAAALKLYDQAVRGARSAGYAQEVALAQELAARHLLSVGAEGEGLLELDRALASWQRWGAHAKVAALQAQRAPLVERLGAGGGTYEEPKSAAPHAVAELDLSSVVKASRVLSEEIGIERLLERLLQILMENAGAQTGALFFDFGAGLALAARASVDEQRVEVVGPRGLGDRGAAVDSAVRARAADLAAQSIVQFVARSRESVVLADASRDTSYGGDPHVIRAGVRSVLCTPLLNRGRLVGVIYLENNRVARAFSSERAEIVQMIASQAANAIRNAQLYDELREHSKELQQVNDSLGRFVPTQFLASLGRKAVTEVKLGDNVRKEMSILFSDVRSFTTLVEAMSAEEHVAFINEYLAFMEPAILGKGGFVDSYIGDAIMALFDGPADLAVQAGIEMSRALESLNVKRRTQDRPTIRMGVGINTGTITLGTIGGPNRIKCGVIGDPVNLAARVESLTKAFGVFLLISDATYARLADPNRYALRMVDWVRVKGRHQPVTLYEVLDAELPDRREDKLATRDQFNRAVELYYNRQFKEAGKLFSKCVSICPDDLAGRQFVAKCWEYGDKGVPADWSGVRDLDHK